MSPPTTSQPVHSQSVNSPPVSQSLDQRWEEIEGLVGRIAELSQSSMPPSVFADEVLKLTATALRASHAALWWTDEAGRWEPGGQAKPGTSGETFDADGVTVPVALLDQIAHGGRAGCCGPDRAGPDGGGCSDGRGLWAAAPVKPGDRVRAVIAVKHAGELTATERSGNEKLLTIVGDLFGNYLRRRETRQLRQAVRRWEQFEHLVGRTHHSLDLRSVASTAVNDGRVFLGCDRVSLMVADRGRFETIAISGVESLDRRSNQIRGLEQVAAAVARSGQWLRYDGGVDGLPPQVGQPLNHYVDLSQALRIDVVPLLAPDGSLGDHGGVEETRNLVGMLVVETFRGDSEAADEADIARLARLIAVSLRNTLDYGSLPFLSFSRWSRRLARRVRSGRRRLLTIGVIGAALLLAPCWLPARLRVDAEGEAWPQVRHDLYAPLDGEVIAVHRDHNQRVAEGETIVALRSADLELEMQRVRGEFQTTQKKLLAIASARLRSDEGATAERYPGQLAAEEQELKQLLASQSRQLELVRRQQELLDVQSPIAGRLLTWNPHQKLERRPVERGQRLVTVADESGPWILELTVPERQARHLLAAAETDPQPLVVEFSLAADRSRRFTGRVKNVAKRTEVGRGRRSRVRVTAEVDGEAITHLRPGAAVFAKIDCGRGSLGYVWLDGAVQALRGWWF